MMVKSLKGSVGDKLVARPVSWKALALTIQAQHVVTCVVIFCHLIKKLISQRLVCSLQARHHRFEDATITCLQAL